jgi:hypothetical protein
MKSVLDRIESKAQTDVETALEKYRSAIVAGTVDATAEATVERWMKELKISTADIKSDKAAARQLALLKSEVPSKDIIATTIQEQQKALNRLEALKLQQLTALTVANGELNKISNERNRLEHKAKITAQQIADLKRANPRL